MVAVNILKTLGIFILLPTKAINYTWIWMEDVKIIINKHFCQFPNFLTGHNNIHWEMKQPPRCSVVICNPFKGTSNSTYWPKKKEIKKLTGLIVNQSFNIFYVFLCTVGVVGRLLYVCRRFMSTLYCHAKRNPVTTH